MFGWTGVFSKNQPEARKRQLAESYDASLALILSGVEASPPRFSGINLSLETDPLSPEKQANLRLLPSNGFGFTQQRQLVVAAKSPLTGGYGDEHRPTPLFICVKPDSTP